MTVMGITVTFNPHIGINMWHFRLPGEDSKASELHSRALILDELRLFAVREFCLGASIIAASCFGERKVLGTMLILGVPVVVVDGIVQRKQVGRGHWVHWGLAPLLAGLGLALWR